MFVAGLVAALMTGDGDDGDECARDGQTRAATTLRAHPLHVSRDRPDKLGARLRSVGAKLGLDAR